MSKRLRMIDELVINQHYHLSQEDDCYYLKEYITGQTSNENKANSLIFNLKKSVLRKEKREYIWKIKAIEEVIKIYKEIFDEAFIKGGITLVPIPPSKVKDDNEYDDRMTRILHGLCEGRSGDVRELIYLSKPLRTSHKSESRPSPTELLDALAIDENLSKPEPLKILLFDDMITTGAHFVACKRLLLERFPGATIKGVFITRRLIEDTNDFEF